MFLTTTASLVLSLFAVPSFQEAPAKPEEPCCHKMPVEDPKLPLPKDRKSVLLRQAAEMLKNSEAPFLGGMAVKATRDRIVALPKNAAGNQIFSLVMSLVDALLNEGSIPEAITILQSCLAEMKASQEVGARNMVLKKLAIAHLRFAERKNCVSNHIQDSCIFPLSDAAIHLDRTGSESAIKQLNQVLNSDPKDMQALWLLNIAHMTLGSYPEGVPRQYQIPPSAFQSEADIGKFRDISPKLGLTMFARAGGSIMDDFDGDGRLDLLLSSMDPNTSLMLYCQQADGTFRNMAVEKGLRGQTGGLQLFHADVNNDGRLDILVQRGAWLRDFGKIPNSLLVQQPDGTFVDRTLEAGIEISAPSQNAAFADIDNDGDLDLFLGYESQQEGKQTRFPSYLFKNRGDGTFEDVTEQSRIVNDGYLKGVVFGDYDGDRFPDLYISNLNKPNRLYHNRGDGTFEDVAVALGVREPIESFACWFFDYNNDGSLDLYATNYAQVNRTAEVANFYMSHTTGSDTGRLYENDGHGGFRDVTYDRGLSRVAFPMGCNFGDADNDGFQDIYLATGDPEFISLWPNQLWRNDRGQHFQDVTSSSGTGHLQKGHGVAFGDLDADGDQDLFVQTGGAVKDDAFWSVLFENPGCGNHWLTVRLIGHQSNRFGVGARVMAQIEEPEGIRNVFSFVSSGSSFGGNSLQQELGLGKATRLVKLEVFWPTTGVTQSFEVVPMDRIVVVEEGNPKLVELPSSNGSHSGS